MDAPEALAADIRRQTERPVMRFVRAQYRTRAPHSGARVSGSQWLNGFQDSFGAVLRLDAVVRLCVVFFELVFFELVFFEDVLRKRSAWALLISPASTRADTHMLESLFAERDMQARKASLPTA
jgi:hypothetical protein